MKFCVLDIHELTELRYMCPWKWYFIFIDIINLLYIYSSKKFCNTYTIFSLFKTFRVCNFAKYEGKCMKQHRNLVWVCGNKYMNFEFTWQLFWKFPKFTFFSRKFCKPLGIFIMFIDETLQWRLLSKIVIKHHFTFPCATTEGLSR